ncbi:hypothetical protein Lal_00017106 [Lupinus albus]|nr:hypothetical protein Lal_00017106 [Lupinus albus]
MRLRSTINNTNHLQIQQFVKWILDVGDEKLSEPNDGYALIEIREQFLITNYDHLIHAIVKSTYPNLVDEYMNEEFLQCRAILASTIDTFDEINDYVLSLIPGLTTEFGKIFYIPRMSLSPSHSLWSFKVTRRQFLLTVPYVMTINKSQGQSLASVGFYLHRPIFDHDQLYVAFSSVKSMEGLKILIQRVRKNNEHSINVVSKELFQNL